MIRRLYIQNFRCLGQFNFEFGGLTSVLMVGKNGAGKSTVLNAIRNIQRLASGRGRIGDVLSEDDLNWFPTGDSKRITLALEAELDSSARFFYEVQLEWPEGFREFRVAHEHLELNSKTLFSRNLAEVNLTRKGFAVGFPIDWHQMALPFIQESSNDDPISRFRAWISKLMIIAPLPTFSGESTSESPQLDYNAANFADWYRSISVEFPSAGNDILQGLKGYWPELVTMVNSPIGKDARSLELTFREGSRSRVVPLGKLSDGEKMLVLATTIMAWAKVTPNWVCCWDEPDNFISIDEVSQFVNAIRSGFSGERQVIATSHNPEAIRKFTRENTFILNRPSHLDSTRPPLRASEISMKGEIADMLARGEVAESNGS